MKELYFRTLYSLLESGNYRRRIVGRYWNLPDVVNSIKQEKSLNDNNERSSLFCQFLSSTSDLLELQDDFDQKRVLADQYDLLVDHNMEAWKNLKKIADQAEVKYMIALLEAKIISE
ncbi:hypothetical protein [Dyadobacter tibetensis]|uniref:hypothetical protein n=1 Tax=Dyadobacter tibetensis TaxID=1211851 RepID=UPI0004724173|nr:hypothetical protein [Dyadobacter tibetensis]